MIKKPCCSRFSLHKFVQLKFLWTQFKNVHLQGPCSLRPCISRPYCNKLRLGLLTFHMPNFHCVRARPRVTQLARKTQTTAMQQLISNTFAAVELNPLWEKRETRLKVKGLLTRCLLFPWILLVTGLLQSSTTFGFVYHKLVSTSLSNFEGHAGFFRVFMKGKFDVYLS